MAHITDFGTHGNYLNKLYNQTWNGWEDLEAIHLSISLRYDYDRSIMIFNSKNILQYNRTFGIMAREIMRKMGFV
jgi:hypothetical protein